MNQKRFFSWFFWVVLAILPTRSLRRTVPMKLSKSNDSTLVDGHLLSSKQLKLLQRLCLSFLAFFVFGQSASAAEYSQTITLPVPPASTYASGGGGDGWDVSLSNEQVFNVFHHERQLRVACHNQSDASFCWPTRTIIDTTNGGSHFQTSGHSGTYFDPVTEHLYIPATRAATAEAGIVCVDTTIAATNANPFCGFIPLTGQREAFTGAYSALSAPMVVGRKIYVFNYVPAAGNGGSGAQNRPIML